MTFGEMYSAAMDLWDKSGSPYMPEEQFNIYANIKYSQWITFEADRLEEDEKYTSQLRVLYKNFSKANSDVIDLVTDVTDFRRRIRLNRQYRKVCNGTVTYPIKNCRPATNATIDIMMDDPFQKPTDEDPVFYQTVANSDPVIQLIGSTTPPLNVMMTYIREPQVIDSENNPNTNFEQPIEVTYILLLLIVYRMDITIENLQRAAAEGAEIASAEK